MLIVSVTLDPTVAVLGAKCYFRLRVSSEGRRGGGEGEGGGGGTRTGL